MKLSQAHNPSLYSHSYYFIIRLVSHPSLCHCTSSGAAMAHRYASNTAYYTSCIVCNCNACGEPRGNMEGGEEQSTESVCRHMYPRLAMVLHGSESGRLQLIALNGPTVRQCQRFQCQHTHTHSSLPEGRRS